MKTSITIKHLILVAGIFLTGLAAGFYLATNPTSLPIVPAAAAQESADHKPERPMMDVNYTAAHQELE